MLVVALTSTIISLLSNPINYFLLVVGIFSFYLTFTGYRAVQLKNTPPQFIDKATTLLMLFTTLIMAGLAAYDWTYGNGQLSIILGIFGGIGGTLTISDLLVYANGLPHPREWMLRHLGRMLGAYVATLTAFVVTNFKGLVPRIYLWTVPTIIGASSILLLIQYYRKVYHIPTRQQQKNKVG